MDPLSITASIVGLLGAAAKVHGLLVLISSVRNAPATIADACTEVKHVELALRSLHRYLQRLDSVRPQRAALIQVDELIVTLADAMMAFFEFDHLLEALSRLARMRAAISWSRHAAQIDDCLAKMQRHKASLVMMLNIMQW